jgi:hypothetical protein
MSDTTKGRSSMNWSKDTTHHQGVNGSDKHYPAMPNRQLFAHILFHG